MANANPIYDPGQSFTGSPAAADLDGARLVAVNAAKANGAPVAIKYCGAADQPIGTLLQATARAGMGTILAPGGVHLLSAAAAIEPGDAIEVAANGQVQRLNAGKRVGVAFTRAARDELVLAQTQF